MMRKSFLPALALCTALYGFHPFQTAEAAGFYIQEQSVSGLGSAFSGSVTNLNDPSTIYFNAAGMTKLPGTQAQLGAHLLLLDAKMTDTGSGGLSATNTSDGGNPYSPSPVPNGFISHQISNDLWLGLGLSAPFGLANEYDDNWFGRFDSTETELTTIDIQPTIAMKVNDKLSLGAGVNIQHADAELKSAVFGGTEGTSTLKGDDWSYGYTLGVQYQPFEKTTLGASYRSGVSHTLEGRVTIVGSTALDRDDAADADLQLPDIATFGVAHDITPKWTLMGQATWFGWNNFESIDPNPKSGTEIAGTIQNYQTTWAFAAGAEYKYSDDLTLRGGMQFDATPTTDEYRTSRTPDGDRTWGSLGASYKYSDNLNLDMAATYIHISDESISLSRNGGLATVSADVESSVGILAIAATYKF